MQSGRMIYLIGASGAGKDSLIDAARHDLAERNVQVVRRIITRSAEAIGEEAIGVSREQFEHMAGQGEFALHWSANGLMYGIPAQIDQAMESGHWVLVNGSRAYLPHALAKYPDLLAVLITVDYDVLRSRLTARGRETSTEIEARLKRNERLDHTAQAWHGEAVSLHTVDNSTTLAEAATRLIAVIDHARVSAIAG